VDTILIFRHPADRREVIDSARPRHFGNVRLRQHILLDNAYEVTTPESVTNATTLLIAQPSDLVLCDVSLPDGSGRTVADKAIAAGVKAPVVTRKDSTPQPGGLAPYDYLPKPLRVIELLDHIERCLAAAVEAPAKR